VCGHDDGEFHFPVKGIYQSDQPFLPVHVQTGSRFIKEKNIGFLCQCPRDLNLLPLAAGKTSVKPSGQGENIETIHGFPNNAAVIVIPFSSGSADPRPGDLDNLQSGHGNGGIEIIVLKYHGDASSVSRSPGFRHACGRFTKDANHTLVRTHLKICQG